jgi:hypothetical protein
MLEATITTTTTHDRNDTTATTRSTRKRITMHTTTSPTIPHRMTRTPTQDTARSPTIIGKTSKTAGRCWGARTRMGRILTT